MDVFIGRDGDPVMSEQSISGGSGMSDRLGTNVEADLQACGISGARQDVVASGVCGPAGGSTCLRPIWLTGY